MVPCRRAVTEFRIFTFGVALCPLKGQQTGLRYNPDQDKKYSENEIMVEFKIVLSDPKSGLSHKVDVSGGAAAFLMGKRVGDEVDATFLGVTGYSIKITGASDRNGTPARQNLPVAGRRKLLLAGGVGFHPVMDGERRRKPIRGNEITADFVQINAKVITYGEKTLLEIFPKAAPAEKAA